jgi:tellurite resistance protein TerC
VDQASVGSPLLWALTIGFVVVLVVGDFLLTRRPHAVTTREAAWWSIFYVSIPLAFGAFIWARFGSERGTEYLAGYVVEKSLSVDNLFVFMLLLSAFAVPAALQQRVLLFGIVGALLLRGVFIALGAAALESFSATFLIFGAILLITAVKVMRDAGRPEQHEVDTSKMRSVRLLERFFPVTDGYRGTRLSVIEHGRRAITPLAVVTVAVLGTDVVFAVDSVPAVYGITGDPYLVFATNAFALLGLRALYFLLAGMLSVLVHLGYGLAAILGLIGTKLVLHWAHGIWPGTPEIPTLLSLALIIGILLVVTLTSVLSTRRASAGLTTDSHPSPLHPPTTLSHPTALTHPTDSDQDDEGHRPEDSDQRPSVRP